MQKIIKKILELLILVSLIQAMFSCQMRLNEKSEVAELKTIKIQSVTCLPEAKKQLVNFFDFKSTDLEIESSLDCLSEVVNTLQEKVKGQNTDYLTQDEVAYIIEQNLSDKKVAVSREFKTNIMKLKTQLLGGELNKFTDAEFKRFSQMILEVKPLLVSLNHTLKFFNQHDQYALEQRQIALNELKPSIQNFYDYLKIEILKNQEKINYQNILDLVVNFDAYRKASAQEVESRDTSDFSTAQNLKIVTGNFIDQVFPDQDLFLKEAESDQLIQFILSHVYNYIDLAWMKKSDENILSINNVDKINTFRHELLISLAHLLDKKNSALDFTKTSEMLNHLFALVADENLGNNFYITVFNILTHLQDSDASFNQQSFKSQDITELNDAVSAMTWPVLQMISRIRETSNLYQYRDHQFNTNQIVNLFDEGVLPKIKRDFVMSDLFSLLNGVSHLSYFFEHPKFKDFLSDKAAIYSAKMLLVNNSDSILKISDLSMMAHLALSLGYNANQFNLKVYDKVDNINIYSDRHSEVDDFSQAMISTLSKWLTERSAEVSNQTLVLFIDSVKSYLFDDKVIQSSSVQNLVDVLLNQILVSPQERFQSSGQVVTIGTNSFNQASILRLAQYINYFLDQNYILADAQKNAKSQSEVLSRFNSYQDNNIQLVKDLNFKEAVYFDLKDVLNKNYIYTFDQNNFIKLNTAEDNQINSSDLFKSSLAHLVSKIFIESFSQDSQRAQMATALNLDEAQAAFFKLRSLAVELELIEPSNFTFMKSRFLESGLFTFHANGDEWASRAEIHDILLHIYSGLKRNDQIQKFIGNSCLAQPEQKIVFETRIDIDCLTQATINLLKYNLALSGYNNLTLWSQKFLELNYEQQKFYILNTLKAAGHLDHGDNTAKFADIDLIVHVFQYIEVLFKEFDTNHDGVLTTPEVYDSSHPDTLAYSIFKPILVTVVNGFPNNIGSRFTDKEYPGVFIYFMKYRKPPEKTKDILKFVSFVSQPAMWQTETHREELAELFSFISSTTSSTTTTTSGSVTVKP